jgi:hypothetical protein
MNVSKSRILAFDPGESTGIAYLEDGNFIWGMFCHSQTFDAPNFLLHLTGMTNPTTIVLESPPTSPLHYNTDQYRIYETLKRTYTVAGYHVLCINPGQWKGLVPRTKLDGTHIRDAADMALLIYQKQQKGESK